MSYEPTNWQAGDTVTSAKLNKIEQGIKNSILVANATFSENGPIYLDKTWQEIYDADFCIVKITGPNNTIEINFVGTKLPANEGNLSSYEIILFGSVAAQQLIFYAATPNDYPSTESVSPGGGDK